MFPPIELHGGTPTGCTPGNDGLFRSTLGSNLRGCLSALQPSLAATIQEGLDAELKAGKPEDGRFSSKKEAQISIGLLFQVGPRLD